MSDLAGDGRGRAEGAEAAPSLSELPEDELRRYGEELGLKLSEAMARGELARRIRERLELVLGLDRDALQDGVIWARRPVHANASKETLAREISRTEETRYEQLSPRGLRVLAALRGVVVGAEADAAALVAALERHDGLWPKLARLRRALVGSVVARLVEGKSGSPAAGAGEGANAYRFLPEQPAERGATLKHEIESRGVIGGLANRLRGAADDYLREKMDEIETRIDRKLDEIDRRLSEWRDQEVLNRLRILKLTLAASVLFALVSLGYHFVTRR
ncbi:MAG: hypothetical protein U1A27_08325 [Phycisphaerae bacterium]